MTLEVLMTVQMSLDICRCVGQCGTVSTADTAAFRAFSAFRLRLSCSLLLHILHHTHSLLIYGFPVICSRLALALKPSFCVTILYNKSTRHATHRAIGNFLGLLYSCTVLRYNPATPKTDRPPIDLITRASSKRVDAHVRVPC
jgi:hypothetical protein